MHQKETVAVYWSVLPHKHITTPIHCLGFINKMRRSKYRDVTNCVAQYLHTVTMKSIFSPAHSSVMV